MELMGILQKNRVLYRLGIITLFWMILGLGVCFYTDTTEYIVPSDGTVLALSEGSNLSQRIIGNDEALQEISFDVVADALPDDATLDVFLTKGNTDCVGGQILRIDSFKGRDLKKSDHLKVPFAEVHLSYLSDYYINFGLSNANGKTLGFRASYDDGHAYVYHDDVCYGCSMAYQALFSNTNSRGLFWWRLFGVFVLFPLFLSVIFESGFWRCVCYSTVSLNVILFVLGITNRLHLIYGALCAIGIIAFTVAVYVCIKRSRAGENVERGSVEFNIEKMLVWFAILVFLCRRDNGLWVFGWDETFHWAMAVKDTYLYDMIPPHAWSSAACYAYPPGLPLFQWLFVTLRGCYDEGVLYLAIHVLEAALFCGMIEALLPKERAKRAIIYVGIAIALWGIPEILQEMPLSHALGVDIPLGFATALLLYELFCFHCKHSRLDILWICMAAVNMCMLKDNGMIHFLAILSAVLIADLGKWFLFERKTGVKGVLSNAATYGFMAICVWAFRHAWNQYVARGSYLIESVAKEIMPDAGGASAQEANQAVSVLQRSGLTPANLLDYLTGKGQPYQYEIILKHIKILFLDRAYRLFGIPTAPYMLVLTLLCVCVWFLFREKRIIAKHVIACMVLSSLACAVAYQLLYTFAMSEQEALVLHSEQRYMGSFLLGLGLFVAALYFNGSHSFRKLKQSQAVCGLIVVVFVLTGFGVNLFRFAVPNKEPDVSFRKDVKLVEQIRKNVREQDKVYFVATSNGHDTQPLRYLLTPTLSNQPLSGWRKGEFYTHSFMPDLEGVKPFEEALQSYDYVFLNSYDEAFLDRYTDLFEDEIIPGALYHVDCEDDHVTLTYTANCRS